ncbi:MFS transporter [Actinoplanes sp. TFC3]|uniref:MFS transporter n=1 Tax=Actinoplanes sp. TFC3 TaxID=1710355 RepID=UPI000830B1C3|nr:MFS transporter [Actinoplanes sp. TFC3]
MAGFRRSRFLVKLTIISTLGATLTFGLFAVVNACSFLFVLRFCPETRGRSLEELEDDFREHDPARFVRAAPAGVTGSCTP